MSLHIDAIKMYDKALEINPNHYDAYANKGILTH